MDTLRIRDGLAAPYRGADGLAPPWVSAVLRELIPDINPGNVYRLLAWCGDGEGCARTRAEHVIMLARLWPGPKDVMFVRFLDAVAATRAGRRKGAKRHPFVPPVIPDCWPEKKA